MLWICRTTYCQQLTGRELDGVVVTDKSSLAVRSEMAEVDSWVGDCGVLEVVSSTLNQEYLQVRIGLCESPCSDTSSRPTSGKDKVNFTHAVVIRRHRDIWLNRVGSHLKCYTVENFVRRAWDDLREER